MSGASPRHLWSARVPADRPSVAGVLHKMLEVLLFTLGGVYQGLSQDWNVLEILILGAVALRLPSGGLPEWKACGALEVRFARLARRRGRASLAVGLSAVAIRVGLIPVFPVPPPVVTDEFSHLLLADTLLHGRVANPAHVLWPHFESPHLLVNPVYVSNYFPGQGAVLAAARWLTGSPWPGILALSGMFAAVLCWSLQGWMPARWALFGSLLAVLRFSIGSYWVNALHGGFLPAIGGALVAGAFARLRGRATVRASCALGAGLVILAYSRPYEGLLFALPFLALLAWEGGRVKALAPAVLLAACALLPLAMYFRAVTSNPLITPYNLSQKQYGWPMTFAWAQPPVIHHANPELRFYYEYELDEHAKVANPIDFIQFFAFRAQEYWRFFVGPLLTVCLAWSAWVFRARRYRALLAGLGGALFAVSLEGAASPHYLAPAAMPIVAIISLGAWRMRARWAHGAALSRIALAAMALILAGRIAAEAAGLPFTQSVNFQSWCCKVPGRRDKAHFTERIAAVPGNHLVIVRAKQDPYNFFQWIYNGAGIDSARIVWARDLGTERNRALTGYYRGRTVWSVDPNATPAVLTLGPPRWPN
jgi:hypothetical protein